ncbi:hypothetical protein DV735_g743, partial [Chaetothyriales sp. CBS 134920]
LKLLITSDFLLQIHNYAEDAHPAIAMSQSLRIGSSLLARVGSRTLPTTTRRAFQVSAVSRADLVQDLYLKELRNYKAPAVKASDAEGLVQKFTPPPAPKSPEEAQLAAEVSEYESQQVEVEGAAVPGETQQSTEEDYFEDLKHTGSITLALTATLTTPSPSPLQQPILPCRPHIDVLSPAQLPIQAPSPLHEEPVQPAGHNRPKLSRSASFTYLSGLPHDGPSLKRTFSENVLALHTVARTAKASSERKLATQVLSGGSRRKKERKRAAVARFTLGAEGEQDEDEKVASSGHDTPAASAASTAAEPESTPKGLSRSVAGTIKSLARKSWLPSSRSSSPTRAQTKPHPPTGSQDPQDRQKASWSPPKKAAVLALHAITVPPPAAAPLPSPMPSPPARSQQASTAASAACPPPVLTRPPRSRSFVRLTRKPSASSVSTTSSPSRSPFRSRSSSPAVRAADALTDDTVPPLPANMSSDRLSGMSGVDPAKRKDPLAQAFRAIESEFTAFQTKTSLQRAKVVRTSLLPFLAKYAQHPSNTSLRAEDLDRRILILNKWWTGILDMLSGGNNLSISGTDRPAFLDAATQLMMRPEWIAPGFASSLSPTATPPQHQQHQHPPRPWASETKLSPSLRSAESDFLTESIYQNVRNTFVQNLLFQMGFVVDRLSMRSAPASLVAFSGKTCAYAFFFCPGVAHLLVRLWRLPPAALRRVFAEAGVAPGERLELTADALAARFPPPVRSLRVTTLAHLVRTIQPSRQLPPMTEHIPWYGPWLGRWCGRDSDLFFVFAKHFHLLVVDLLREAVSPKDRVCIPGLAPVHAQMLVVLETTIHRQAGHHATDTNGRGVDGADALASLPMTIANASRMIAENRLVMVLRDILSDRASDNPLLAEFYASCFCDILKAAARKISLYNNDACFVLCDFLEEIFPILTRHCQHSDTPFLDWPFWLQVCRLMAQSHNTLTQVRLIAFVYSTWSIWTRDEQRKRHLVLDWLLDPHFFDQYFCHWSPMVRHYYFRLLCWRLGRCDDNPSPLDLQILETIAARLNRCWAHYQYLSAEADMRNLCPPSTAPCSPAPSRSLVIIRTDNQALPSNVFSSLDPFLSPGLANQQPSPVAASSQSGTKKRWSLLKMLGPFASAPANTRPGEVTPPPSPERTGPSESENSSGTPPHHMTFSFRFSLEWVESQDARAAKHSKLSRPQIPAIGQKTLDCRTDSVSSSESDKSGTSTARRDIAPLKPTDRDLAAARYSGRALAEWAQVLAECQNFYLRRRHEGVPRDSLVETPTMGVETFRMLG